MYGASTDSELCDPPASRLVALQECVVTTHHRCLDLMLHMQAHHWELDKEKGFVSVMLEIEFRILCILGTTELYHQHKMKIKTNLKIYFYCQAMVAHGFNPRQRQVDL